MFNFDFTKSEVKRTVFKAKSGRLVSKLNSCEKTVAQEFEMNARGVWWDLVLNKPYSDGGYENSSRVFPNGWVSERFSITN